MGKTKRLRNLSVYGHLEGKREKSFISALIEIYGTLSNNIKPEFNDAYGGVPDKIVSDTLRQCHRDKSFAWFDEDFEPSNPLSKELRKTLAVCWNITDEETLAAFFQCSIKDLQQTYNPQNTKKPTLIVSQPVCVDGLILLALGEVPSHATYIHAKRDKQIREQKSKLNQLINGQAETDFYKQKLTLEILEERKNDIPLLKLLISMITKE